MSDVDRQGGTSYLVRLWSEPRGAAAGEAPVRVYVRELRSGKERYLKDVAALAEFLDGAPRPRADAGPAAATGHPAG